MKRLLAFALLLAGQMILMSLGEAREYSALVVEPESGRVLYEKYAEELRHPASVTKMMTLYLVFEALERGDLTLNAPLAVSRNAVLRPPSRLGLTPGDTLSVEDAILGLVTRSANDAATVIAENLGGTEVSFAGMMTAKARSLGMRDTVFRNASGLPDADQVTTAWDMYRLGKALINDFPRYYPYFSTPRFYYRGQSFDNHNHLMETYPGMDGIKTGFINSSGFNLVASVRRGGRRIIGVVFGGPSAVRRDSHMKEILDDGFSQLNGAPPGYIEAKFEKSSASRGQGRLYAELDNEPPQVTFGNAKRFKGASTPSGYQRAATVADSSRYSKPALQLRSRAAVSHRREQRESSRAAHRTAGTVSKASPKSTSTHSGVSAVAGKGRHKAHVPLSVAASKSRTAAASSLSTKTCKGAKGKTGKCLAK